MRLWKVVLLLNLALVVGLLLGWVAWGRHLPRLEGELSAFRQRMAPPGAERVYTARGVVRAVLPEIGVVVLTHEEIADFMPPMTMGFRTKDPRLLAGVRVGDVVRFTLRGVPPDLAIVDLSREGES